MFASQISKRMRTDNNPVWAHIHVCSLLVECLFIFISIVIRIILKIRLFVTFKNKSESRLNPWAFPCNRGALRVPGSLWVVCLYQWSSSRWLFCITEVIYLCLADYYKSINMCFLHRLERSYLCWNNPLFMIHDCDMYVIHRGHWASAVSYSKTIISTLINNALLRNNSCTQLHKKRFIRGVIVYSNIEINLFYTQTVSICSQVKFICTACLKTTRVDQETKVLYKLKRIASKISSTKQQ